MAQNLRYVPYYLIACEGGDPFEMGRNKEITSVRVTDHADKADEFEFKLRDFAYTEGHFPQDRLRWIEDPRLQLGKKVEITMGYVKPEAQEKLIMGEITRAEPNFSESGGVEITVSGHSLFHRLAKHRRTQKFVKMNYKEICQQIAGDHGLRAEVKVDSIRDEVILQGNSGNAQTDADFLNRLADKYSCEVVVKEKKLIVRPIANNLSPILTLQWGRDLKSFTPTINTNGLRTRVRARGVATQGGGKVGETFDFTVEQPSSEAHKMGKQLGTQIAQRTLTKHHTDRIEGLRVANREEAEKIAEARFNRNALEFLKGSGAAIGEVKIMAGKVIKLDKLGNLFSGNYYVTQATHTIDDSGYATTFEVKRSALG